MWWDLLGMKNHTHAPPDEVGYAGDMDIGYLRAQKEVKNMEQMCL